MIFVGKGIISGWIWWLPTGFVRLTALRWDLGGVAGSAGKGMALELYVHSSGFRVRGILALGL